MFLLLDLAAAPIGQRKAFLFGQHNSMLSALAIVADAPHFTLIFIRVNLNSFSIISSPRSGTLKKLVSKAGCSIICMSGKDTSGMSAMLMEAIADQILATDKDFPEVSIIMPCLNEADTLAACISKARRALNEQKIAGEIIVADNGSTDGSQAIARKLGARLVNVREKGYGSALMGGILAARGKYIIMGDADDSYDFLETPKFVEKLREGFDIVQGCRLRFRWRCRKAGRHAVSSPRMG